MRSICPPLRTKPNLCWNHVLPPMHKGLRSKSWISLGAYSIGSGRHPVTGGLHTQTLNGGWNIVYM